MSGRSLPSDTNSHCQGGLKTNAASDGRARTAGDLFISQPTGVAPNTDYLMRVPLKIRQGGVVIEVADSKQNNVLASSPILHAVNWLDLTPESQPTVLVELPFVSGNANQVKIKLTNEYKSPELAAVAELGPITGFRLGPASQLWSGYPRRAISFLQKFFITALMLPLTLLGVIVVARARRWPACAWAFLAEIEVRFSPKGGCTRGWSAKGELNLGCVSALR